MGRVDLSETATLGEIHSGSWPAATPVAPRP